VLGEWGSPCAILNFSHHEQQHLDLKYFKMDLMSTQKLKYKWIKCKTGDQAYMHSLLDCGTSCINFLLLFIPWQLNLTGLMGATRQARPITHNVCLSLFA
jgi:hypothetical protein